MSTLLQESELQTDVDLSSTEALPADTDDIGDTVAIRRRAIRQTGIAVLLATAILAFWLYFIRSGRGDFSVDLSLLGSFGIDPYLLGIAIQELLPPVILFLVLSRTSLFQRAVSNELQPSESAVLTAILVVIFVLFVVFEFWIVNALQVQITFGIFIVTIAGLLGGLYAGLAVGVVSAFGMGLVNYLIWGDSDPFNFGGYVIWHVVESIEAMNAIWVGIVAGLIGEAIPWKRRFLPGVVLLIGLFTTIVVGITQFLSEPNAEFYVIRFLPGLIASSAGLLAFSVMATAVQNERARQKAERDQLALSEANLKLAQTSLALTQAELRALHAQINPHFFFNSLNTIRYFIRTDPENARDLLTKLSEIFQRSLSAGELISLDDEMHHVEAYLALEKARLEERLQIVWTNMAKEYGGHLIPTLIVQPLVENAVIHGLSPKPEGGTIHILINAMDDKLLIQVDDDGVGFKQHPVPMEDATAQRLAEADNLSTKPLTDRDRKGSGHSIGLNNIHERLRMLYDEAGSLRIESQPGQGTRAILTIPINSTV